MARVTKRRRVRLDLREIWRYIAADDPAAADSFLRRIGDLLGLLAENPQLGRARPELGPDLRGFPIGNYIIFFRPLPDQESSQLVRVLHAARNIGPAFFPSERL